MGEVSETVNPVYFGGSDRDPEHEDAVAGLFDLLDRADAENRTSRVEISRLGVALAEADVEIRRLRSLSDGADAELRRLRSLLDGWALWPVRVLWRIGRQTVSLIRRN
jgi:hypothetical protein